MLRCPKHDVLLVRQTPESVHHDDRIYEAVRRTCPKCGYLYVKVVRFSTTEKPTRG